MRTDSLEKTKHANQTHRIIAKRISRRHGGDGCRDLVAF
jgi:hypothetical protein